MNIKELETLGYYEPGFLHLRINTDRDLTNLNELAKDPATSRYFSTFLHEYIHFPQNMTTTAGLLTSVFCIDLIKDLNWEVIHDGKAEFKTPFEITNKNNIEANIKLRKIYLGDKENINYIKYDGFIVEREGVSDKAGNVVSPERYKVFYYNESRQQKTFYFGSLCLTEYVAHAIQSKFYPATQHPDVPYVAPELVINKEYPEFGNDTMLIAALCDACMMNFHPAQMFFNTIQRMKNENFIPHEPKDVYEFAYKGLKFKNPENEFNVNQLFEYTSNLALKQYQDATQAPIFTPNYNLFIRRLKR